MERIVADYPYSSVNIETNRRIEMDNNIGYEYSRVLNLVTDGKRVRNIGQTISRYDKIWASIK